MSNKNSEISARVAEMINLLDETPNSFAKALGYTRSQTIYDIISGKSAPSYDFFNKFAISEYSETINLRWLITGLGDKNNVMSPKMISNNIQAAESSTFLIEKIVDQAEEIGRLRERISQLEREKGKDASDVPNSGIANVG